MVTPEEACQGLFHFDGAAAPRPGKGVGQNKAVPGGHKMPVQGRGVHDNFPPRDELPFVLRRDVRVKFSAEFLFPGIIRERTRFENVSRTDPLPLNR